MWVTNTLGKTLEILSNYPWTRLSVRKTGAIKRQFFHMVIHVFDNSNLSHKIFAIDTWRAVICSLGHGHIKVGSHDPVLVQLSFQIFLCMMKNVGIHTIQFSHPIISWCTPEKHDNSCFENLGPFHRSWVQQSRPFCKNILQNRAWKN